MYEEAFVWSAAVATQLETGLENVHLLFGHLKSMAAKQNTNAACYPNELWETEGRNWLHAYRRNLGLPALLA